MKSFISLKAEIKTSNIQGKGLFAKENINKDEVVAIKGGHIFDAKTLDQIVEDIEESYIQIEHNFYIGAIKNSEVKANKLFLNHSCDPNIGIKGQIIFVAMRDIEHGEELTYDWAMENDQGSESWKLKCHCSQPDCRKIINGNDWQRSELQQKYKGYFSSYIQKMIEDGKCKKL